MNQHTKRHKEMMDRAMTEKHSPLPWSIRPDCETKKIQDANGDLIAMLSYVHLTGRRPSEEVAANAALIVRSVNALPDLVAALEELLEMPAACSTDEEVTNNIIRRNRAVALLAKVRGKQRHDDFATCPASNDPVIKQFCGKLGSWERMVRAAASAEPVACPTCGCTASQNSPFCSDGWHRTPDAEIVAALSDSAFLAGAKAGWNAANSDNPDAEYQKLVDGRAGYLKPILEARK